MNCFVFFRIGPDNGNDGCGEDRGSPIGERGQEEGAQQALPLPGRMPGIQRAATHPSSVSLLQVFIQLFTNVPKKNG